MAFTKQNLQNLLQVALDNNASDVHIRTTEAPAFRIRGEIIPVQTKPFGAEDMLDLVTILTNQEISLGQLSSMPDTDGSYEIKDLCRVRFNIYRYSGRIGVILRLISLQIPSIEALKLPEVIKTISNARRGLVMVTGATGSGKSTTLAAMVNHINSTRGCHILTLEDPIEFLHQQQKSRISQREIGRDVENFAQALRAALRQDPDVILIGEMRDPETISIALKAAETGHLVLSTVHTTDAINTVGRIISMFSENEQQEVRKRLAENLTAIVSQRMLKGLQKKKVVIAQEILLNNPGIKECILGKEPIHRISNIIAQGKNRSSATTSSQTFDQHILELYENGAITKETALEAVTSQTDFLKNLVID